MQITRIYDTVADYQKSFDLINRGYAPEQRSAGQYFETTEEIYTYFLNVLPPLDFTADGFSMSEFSTGSLTDCFLRCNGRYFCLCISRRNSANFHDALREFHATIAAEV